MGMGSSDEGKINTPGRQTGRMKIPVGFQIALILLVLIFGPIGAIKWLTQPQSSGITFPTGVTVVTGVQHIGKLETVSDTFQQIIQYEADGNWFTKIFNDPKKLFVVYGNVVAGVDLSTITKNDVTIQKKDSTHTTATLTLPAPQIFSATLDHTKTKIYDISGGILAPFNQGMDPNTENQVMAGAQGSLRSAACQAHILQQASDSAQTQLTSFLTTLGFSSVTVNATSGICQ
jgi:hypothetical protein